MRLKFWKRKQKKNPFEASLILDNPDVKVVEARYKKKPFFIGVGISQQRDVKGVGEVGSKGLKGEYRTQKDLMWHLLYNPNVLPNGFMPMEKLKDWMASTVSAVSGSMSVYEAQTDYKESDIDLDILIKELDMRKGKIEYQLLKLNQEEKKKKGKEEK